MCSAHSAIYQTFYHRIFLIDDFPLKIYWIFTQFSSFFHSRNPCVGFWARDSLRMNDKTGWKCSKIAPFSLSLSHFTRISHFDSPLRLSAHRHTFSRQSKKNQASWFPIKTLAQSSLRKISPTGSLCSPHKKQEFAQNRCQDSSSRFLHFPDFPA